jgi:hypothetical protein
MSPVSTSKSAGIFAMNTGLNLLVEKAFLNLALFNLEVKNLYFAFFSTLTFDVKSIKLFSKNVTNGTNIKKYPKYKTVANCPNSIKGDSTCFAPNCINIKKFATKTKNIILLKGLNCEPLSLDRSANGNVNNANNAANIAITPNNLFGIDLNIA